MKRNIVAIGIIAISLAIYGCSSNQAANAEAVKENVHKNGSDEKEEHSEDDGHNHEEGDGHDHSEGDGHDHGAEESKKDSHADEIAFTAEQAAAVNLVVESVKSGDFVEAIKTSGQILSAQGDEETIVATSGGIVNFTSSSLTEGKHVSSGETIATISAKQLADGDPFEKSKIAFETAQKEYQRAQKLIEDNIISTKEYEQIKQRYELARTSYNALSNNASAKGVRVSSTMSGYIKNRLVNNGDYVSVGQPIATITKNKQLLLRAEVSEKYFYLLKRITSANFKTAYDNKLHKLSSLNGRLVSFAKSSGETSFYIPVTFEFNNVGDFIAGSYTEVYLLTSPIKNVISIPTKALTEDQGLYFVYLQIEPEAYKKQEVTIGGSNGDRVQILSGLKQGDKVVTNGVYQVKIAANATVIPDGHSH